MALGLIHRIWRRVYAGYLMPSCLEEYRRLLESALDRGYQIGSIRSFYNQARNSALAPERKYLVLRHDIDSDTEMARLQWRVESDLGISSSYFFRLCTLDVPLMQQIQQAGSEASYHYEELATAAKRRCLRTVEAVQAELPAIRARFRANLLRLRAETGLPMTIVASHGDWINRALKLSNTEVLHDLTLRTETGIDLEAYDDDYLRHVDLRISDTIGYDQWSTRHPMEAMDAGTRVIELLIHPGQWRRHVTERFCHDMGRVDEAIRYRLGLRGNLP